MNEIVMNFNVTPFATGTEYSLIINDFVPNQGYENFLREFCVHLGESFIDWYQGVESGIGHIVYKEKKVMVFWTDFPFSLSFNCQNEIMAIELKKDIINYLSNRFPHLLDKFVD